MRGHDLSTADMQQRGISNVVPHFPISILRPLRPFRNWRRHGWYKRQTAASYEIIFLKVNIDFHKPFFQFYPRNSSGQEEKRLHISNMLFIFERHINTEV